MATPGRIMMLQGDTLPTPPTSGQILFYAKTNGLFYTLNSTGTESPFGGAAGSVTSVAASGGTTGLTFTGTPITNSGTLTLGGTLSSANGGTGLATLGSAKQYLRTNAGVSAIEWATLAASDISGLATVAQTGAYADLTGKPTAYTLPIASPTLLGGIKIGSGLSIDGTGIVSVIGAGGGGGVVISTANAQNLGIAAPGSTGQVSDAGHVHNLPTSAAINAIGIPVAWNAATNSPSLTSSVAPLGNNSYVVTNAGTTTLNGITSWALNDIALFNGTVWTKIAASNAGTVGSSVLKGDGAGGISNAVAGVDYLAPNGLNTGVTFAMAPAGTVGSNGALTLGTAFIETYPAGLWVYFPANAITGANAAGFYWVTGITGGATTGGVIWNTTYTPGTNSGAGSWKVPSSPVAFAGTSGFAYSPPLNTGIPCVTMTIPGGSMGPNGFLSLSYKMRCNATATKKSLLWAYGTTGSIGSSIDAQSTTQLLNAGSYTLWNTGTQVNQFGATDVAQTSTGVNVGTVNSAADQVFTISLRVSTATSDWIALTQSSVITSFGA